MNKQIGIIVGVIALFALIGALVFLKMGKSSPAGNISQQAGDGAVKNSLRSLLGAGKNVKCTYKDSTAGISDGTVYVSGEKVRADYTFSDNTQGMEDGHFISDGGFGYFWTSGETQGTKFKIEEPDVSGSESTEAEGPQTVDLDKDVDLDCSSWSVDNSQFTPPANVEFLDISTLIPSGLPEGQSGAQDQTIDSSLCEQITDPDAKAACLQYSQ